MKSSQVEKGKKSQLGNRAPEEGKRIQIRVQEEKRESFGEEVNFYSKHEKKEENTFRMPPLHSKNSTGRNLNKIPFEEYDKNDVKKLSPIIRGDARIESSPMTRVSPCNPYIRRMGLRGKIGNKSLKDKLTIGTILYFLMKKKSKQLI